MVGDGRVVGGIGGWGKKRDGAEQRKRGEEEKRFLGVGNRMIG